MCTHDTESYNPPQEHWLRSMEGNLITDPKSRYRDAANSESRYHGSPYWCPDDRTSYIGHLLQFPVALWRTPPPNEAVKSPWIHSGFWVYRDWDHMETSCFRSQHSSHLYSRQRHHSSCLILPGKNSSPHWKMPFLTGVRVVPKWRHCTGAVWKCWWAIHWRWMGGWRWTVWCFFTDTAGNGTTDTVIWNQPGFSAINLPISLIVGSWGHLQDCNRSSRQIHKIYFSPNATKTKLYSPLL